MQYYFNIDIPVAYFIRIVYYVYITFNPLAKHFAPGTLNWFQLMLSSVILLFSAKKKTIEQIHHWLMFHVHVSILNHYIYIFQRFCLR